MRYLWCRADTSVVCSTSTARLSEAPRFNGIDSIDYDCVWCLRRQCLEETEQTAIGCNTDGDSGCTDSGSVQHSIADVKFWCTPLFWAIIEFFCLDVLSAEINDHGLVECLYLRQDFMTPQASSTLTCRGKHLGLRACCAVSSRIRYIDRFGDDFGRSCCHENVWRDRNEPQGALWSLPHPRPAPARVGFLKIAL